MLKNERTFRQELDYHYLSGAVGLLGSRKEKSILMNARLSAGRLGYWGNSIVIMWAVNYGKQILLAYLMLVMGCSPKSVYFESSAMTCTSEDALLLISCVREMDSGELYGEFGHGKKMFYDSSLCRVVILRANGTMYRLAIDIGVQNLATEPIIFKKGEFKALTRRLPGQELSVSGGGPGETERTVIVAPGHHASIHVVFGGDFGADTQEAECQFKLSCPDSKRTAEYRFTLTQIAGA